MTFDEKYEQDLKKMTKTHKVVGVFIVVTFFLFMLAGDLMGKNRTQDEINQMAYDSNDYLPVVCSNIAEKATSLEVRIKYPFGPITSNNQGSKMVAVNYQIRNMYGAWIKATAYCEMDNNANITKAYSSILSAYVPLLDSPRIREIESMTKNSLF